MKNEEVRHFGERIRRLRKDKGLGVRELARNSGLSSSLITRLEQGEAARPHMDTLKALASVLDAPLAELFGLGGIRAGVRRGMHWGAFAGVLWASTGREN